MTDQELIATFVAGGEELRAALQGLSQEELTARPGPGAWSILELAVHLADTDALMIERMKRIVCEDRPQLPSADENVWIERLAPHAQSAEDAALLSIIGRRQFARTLAALPAEAWDRIGIHSVKGELRLRDLLALCVRHHRHHLDFLRQKRERLGR